MGFQNFYATKLQNSIGASDTTIKVQTPPTVTSGRLVLEPRNPSKREIIQFTGVSGTDLTGVVRGIGGTSPTPHNNGSLVQMSVVAEDLDDALNINGNLIQYTSEMFADSVVRGTGEVTIVSGRTASISDITYYMGGIRLTKTGIPNKTFTASRNTYCYIDTLGAVSYIETTTSEAAPATPANSLLFAIVRTTANAIDGFTLASRSPARPDSFLPGEVYGFSGFRANIPGFCTQSGNRIYFTLSLPKSTDGVTATIKRFVASIRTESGYASGTGSGYSDLIELGDPTTEFQLGREITVYIHKKSGQWHTTNNVPVSLYLEDLEIMFG